LRASAIGNEIFGTIRHAPQHPAQQLGGVRVEGGRPADAEQPNRKERVDEHRDHPEITVRAQEPQQLPPSPREDHGYAGEPLHNDLEVGMDDMMLDSVIIPALDSVSLGDVGMGFALRFSTLVVSQLSLRVPNNEARQALVRLRLAFEEAERLIPGVTCALVAEIVEGVEQVDDDGH
jgi:hypothetical protein